MKSVGNDWSDFPSASSGLPAMNPPSTVTGSINSLNSSSVLFVMAPRAPPELLILAESGADNMYAR